MDDQPSCSVTLVEKALTPPFPGFQRPGEERGGAEPCCAHQIKSTSLFMGFNLGSDIPKSPSRHPGAPTSPGAPWRWPCTSQGKRQSKWRAASALAVEPVLACLSVFLRTWVAPLPFPVQKSRGGPIWGSSLRSSSREVRIREATFAVVYCTRGTLPQKRGERALLGDLVSFFLGEASTFTSILSRDPIFQETINNRWETEQNHG